MNTCSVIPRAVRLRQAAAGPFRLVCCASLAIAGLLPSASLRAQTQPSDADAPVFDVVSVKPSGTTTPAVLIPGVVGGLPTSPFKFSPGRVLCKNSLSFFLREAYQVKPWQISGPSWLTEDAFQVDATMPAGTTRQTARLMLRAMLADRFALKLHTEQKDVPVYALVAAKGGFKLKEVEAIPGGGGSLDTGRYFCNRARTSSLAEYLSGLADRPVLDMTGLTGAYEIELRWSHDESSDAAGLLASLGQVGLRLEPRKLPTPVLVIDHVERKPTPN